MKVEDLPEEHRKYLNAPSNPKVSNSSLLAMLSDTMLSLARVEEKQNGTDKKVDHLETSVDRLADRIGGRVIEVETDFQLHCLKEAESSGKIGERFRWQEKMQKLILSLVIFLIGLVLALQLGLAIPFP